MHFQLFHILGLPVYSYGLMLVIGFLLALQLAKFLGKKVGIHPDILVTAALVAIFSGVVGARLSHVLENFSEYTRADRSAWANILAAIDIRSGGLTFYGGLILATPITILYGVWKKAPILRGMDVIAPCVMIGLALGRVGCFFNGCCWGEVCPADRWYAVQFPYGSPPYEQQLHDGLIPPPPRELLTDIGQPVSREVVANNPVLQQRAAQVRSLPVQPAQLYSALDGLLISGFLVSYFFLYPRPGRVFAAMLLLGGLTRFLLELLRIEPPVIGHGSGHLAFLPGMSFSMVVGLLLFVIGAIFWLARGHNFGKLGLVEPV